jgi:hypothetical protein
MRTRVATGNATANLLLQNVSLSLIVQSVAKDSFADFLILCKLEPGDEVRRVIGFQCKAMESNIGINEVNKEIAKFAAFVDASRRSWTASDHENNQPPNTAVFVILLTGSGTQEVEKLRGKLLSKSHDHLNIQIPVGMEVIIPTEYSVKNFIFEVNFDQVSNIDCESKKGK